MDDWKSLSQAGDEVLPPTTCPTIDWPSTKSRIKTIFNKTKRPSYWTNDLLEEISMYNVAAVHDEQVNSQDDHSVSWTVHLHSSKLYK